MVDDPQRNGERRALYEAAHDAYHEAREMGCNVVGDLTRHIVDAVLDALGLEQVGWKDTSGLAWIRTFGLHADDQHQKDCCPSDGCVPVFTARTSGRSTKEGTDG